MEFLAWIIDFEPRPYKFGLDYLVGIELNEEPGIPDKDEEKEESYETTLPEVTKEKEFEENDPSLPKKNKTITRKTIVPMMVLSLVTIGVYLYTDHGAKAYICDKGSAKKYHISDKCPALKNCKNEFVQTTVVEAEKNGKTLCGFEHK